MRDKFHEDSDFLLEDALRKHVRSLKVDFYILERADHKVFGTLVDMGPNGLLCSRQCDLMAIHTSSILPGSSTSRCSTHGTEYGLGSYSYNSNQRDRMDYSQKNWN